MVHDDRSALNLPVEQQQLLEQWRTAARYQETRAELEQLRDRVIRGDRDAIDELRDAFAGPLPIGTGGRRGKVGPGPNRINVPVLRETAVGLALAIERANVARKVAIVFDSRRDSARFAEVVAAQLIGCGLEVLLVTEARPTPLLSFMVRARACGAGIVISASHNPPSDNGIKIYWADGAQVLGATDRALMDAIVAAAQRDLPAMGDTTSPSLVRLDPNVGEGAALVAEYLAFVSAQAVRTEPLDGLRVIHTSLHGVGHTTVVPVLRARHVDVTTVREQLPDGGRFGTIDSANPEQPAAFRVALELAEAADLVLANDPDADRLGVMARTRAGGPLEFIDGNRLGVLMLDHILRHGGAVADGWVLTTVVTSPLIGTLARHDGVDVVDDLLVGFKHHAGMIEEHPERPCIFATEESHGYSRGTAVRDKDGAIAALLVVEAAWVLAQRGQTLFERLHELWETFGYHREQTANLFAYGADGRHAIEALMALWREAPPTRLAGCEVVSVEDRLSPRSTGSPTRDLPGNVLILDMAVENGVECRVVMRPSGTEPKIKLYALARSGPRVKVDEAIKKVDRWAQTVLGDIDAMARAFFDERLGGA